MIIALDIQHLNKPPSASNPKSSKDRGVAYGTLTEVDISTVYANLARQLLDKAGHTVYMGFTGEYSERQSLAVRMKTDVYIACHVNAGKGSYSLIEIKKKSSGKDLPYAQILLDALLSKLGTKKASTPIWELQEGDRGFSCISNTQMVSLLLEPFFIDNDEYYKKVLTGELQEQIAQAILEAVTKWSQK